MIRLNPGEPSEHYMTRRPPPRALLPVLSMLCLSFLPACSRENDDWRAAQATDTVAVYQQFSREHPASAHAAEADARATQLIEDEDWRRAQEDDGLQAYQQFVQQHPESHWAQEARVRIETITLGNVGGTAPGTAASPPAAPAPEAAAKPEARPESKPAAKPAAAAAVKPPAKPAVVASAAAPAAAFYGVQLGAFGSESAAQSQWTAIAGKHAALRGHTPRITAATTASGRLYRLQTAAKDEADARELCRSLSTGGQPCVVVHP